ncbi:uncharacterized protein LOC128304798 isoform X1 [Anopheles moucheti]|uniref:uncharacterized protein LOC128304798 isoform X1 n=1 Tax=Anopheles moucheti TaxID=186751 RepID=UPI0022F03471|nr:uncharacterized protein LOC128304798 isoform X1 [Anopheles moucheti]
MDLEDRELAVLEERLYSSIHHSYAEDPKIPDPAPVPSQPLRIVSRTSVINNAQGTLPANMNRYWVGSSISSAGERAAYPKNIPTIADPKHAPPERNTLESNKEVASNEAKRMFLAPYQSLLANMDDKVSENQPSVPEVIAGQKGTDPERTAVPKAAPKDPRLQLKKKKQTKQKAQYVEKKLESLLKLINKDRKQNAMQTFESKKAKAHKVRQHKRAPVVVAEITLNSSDEDSQSTTKNNKSTMLSVSDGEGDEVIIIPTPPPPQICIDCSDEEETPTIQFALPKSKKGGKTKGHTIVASSPRCGSPSNSSIMSDDFIGQHDRSRLNDSFTGSIPSDDELECSKEGKSGKAKDAAEVRPGRIPSISSEDTVCTSGDTTDHEKHPPETGKGITMSKSPSQVNSSGNTTNSKSRKENAATSKKTPSKQKSSKMSTSTPTTAAAMSPSSVSKRNANNNANSGAIANTSKTPGKSKARSKSPVTLAIEMVRKKFEAQQALEDSAKKAKAKKDAPTLKVTRSISKSITQASSGTTVKKSTKRNKNGLASKNSAGTKSKTKKIPPIDENVSSESDIDICSKINSSNTSQGRRSASFIEQIDDVSSESDYDDSFLQSKKMEENQTVEKEPKKRIGRKRKQYNSETYSDEDFACALTDIVRALSDTDDEDDDTEAVAFTNNESNSRTAAENTVVVQPKSSAKQDHIPKKKRKVKHVAPEPENIVVVDRPMRPVNNKTNLQQQTEQPELGAKKKKKSKEPKSNVNATASIDSTSSNIQMHLSEKVHCPSNAMQQTQAMERKGRSAAVANVQPPQSLQQIMFDSNAEDVQMYEDIQCHVVPGTSGESSKKNVPIGPDCAWNEEMKQFYNTSWTDEDFNLDVVLSRMPYDSRHWSILHKDRYPDPPKRDIICSRCGDRGHMQFKCRNAPKQPSCFMCGETGHKEPRCPKTICLNCGAKTRSFVRGCNSCARDAGMICFSCGTRGHQQRSCPDLWRRYHSTIEDNVPLREDYQQNNNARWCSICGKVGHQASVCNDARRIFSHEIPNMKVSSYMPAYRGEYNRGNKHRNDEQERRLATDPTARYNLFSTDANGCEFNLPELAHNENGFYYSFLKATGLLEKYERGARNDFEDTVMQQPQALLQPAAEAPSLESTRSEPPVSYMDETTILPPPPQTVHVAELYEQEPINSATSEVPVAEENSNYSFSEFHTDEIQMDDVQQNVNVKPPPSDNPVPMDCNNRNQLMLSDFIPLTIDPGETLLPVPLPEPQTQPALPAPAVAAAAVAPPAEALVTGLPVSSVTDSIVKPQKEEKVDEDAKVLLTPERATLLLSAQGSQFLKESGKKHSVQLSIMFETVGNVLHITGTIEAQQKFHEELVSYLTQTEHFHSNQKYFQAFSPKLSNKMTRYIALFLRGLVHDPKSISELLKKLRNAQSDESKEKIRRRLNVQLFGVWGLREGRKHLNRLRHQLALCMKANPWKSELPQERRTMVDDSIRYIFSAYDHKTYGQFVREYEELKQANKLKKITYNDLGIPRIITRPKTQQEEQNKKKVQEERKKRQEEKKKEKAKLLQQKVAERIARGPSPVDKQYAHFIKKATRPIDPNRLNQLDNATRNVQTAQGIENVAQTQQQPRNSRRANNRARQRGKPSPSTNHWYGWPETGNNGQSSYSADLSQLAERAFTLREEEMSLLQTLQDLLR